MLKNKEWESPLTEEDSNTDDLPEESSCGGDLILREAGQKESPVFWFQISVENKASRGLKL